MNSIILLFIILFWVIGLVSKILEKTNPRREEELPGKLPKEFSLFQPRIEPVYIEQTSEQIPKIKSQIAQKVGEQKITETEKTAVMQKPIAIEAGITLENMLESTSSLKKAIVLAEILNKPVCLR